MSRESRPVRGRDQPRTITGIETLRAELDETRRHHRSVGFVATMGYLHDGHRALVEQAVGENDVVVVSIFVNPLQFGPQEDLDAYPRDPARDVAVIADAGGHLVFAPSVTEMYATPTQTTVTVSGALGDTLEGASRPTHLPGVATVVTKLFGIVGPSSAYFGEKDWQQLAVVRRLAADLSFPVQVIGCPTVREADGLALSSRNAYLTAEERSAAPVLHRALESGAQAIADGERSAGVVRTVMRDAIAAAPLAHLDYVAVVDAASLAPVDPLRGQLRLLAAATFGRARLIDNVGALAD